MSVPRLSVCIPTYNFASTIGETLDSIVAQIEPGVEIVVLDSASTDDTEAVVAQRIATCDAIRYVRADAKGGIDRDMARVVSLAAAEMVWLFSADDVMRPGALATVLRTIAEMPADVLLIRHSNCTIDMTVLHPSHPVLTGPSRRFAIADAASREAYFAAAETTEAFFSYISGIIVRRSTWDRLADAKMFIGSCWSHAARLLAGMRGDFSVAYLSDVLVDRRGENDSFGQNGVVRRYALAIDGYTGIVEHLFGAGSIEAWHIRRVLRREFGLVMFMLACRRCLENPASEDRAQLDGLFDAIYGDAPGCAAVRFAYRSIPPRLFLHGWATARRLYRMVR